MAITGKTRILGVWGYPVTHSLSPVMHNAALLALGLDWVYVPFSVEPGKLDPAVEAIRALDLVGINITVPLKERTAPLLDHVDPAAARINSVNTIVNENGILTGYSTDGGGLLWDLRDKSALPGTGGTVLILGAGGSARAVADAFSRENLTLIIANRTVERAERLVNELGICATVPQWTAKSLAGAVDRADLIVNTTTIGLSRDCDDDLAVFSACSFGPDKILYDLVYSPPETALMRLARRGGSAVYNGLGMLVRQGAMSLQLWTGLDLDCLPISVMESALTRHITES